PAGRCQGRGGRGDSWRAARGRGGGGSGGIDASCERLSGAPGPRVKGTALPLLTHRLAQRGSCQDPRRIEDRKRRVGIADQQRDLRTPQHRRISSTLPTLLDDVAEERTRGVLEP